MWLIGLVTLLHCASAYDVDVKKLDGLAKARVERIALSDLTRSEINELLGTLGFYKKAQPEDEVPEEFRFSPAKDSPFKDESAGKSYTSSLATENSPGPNAEVEHTDL
ncbi:Selenoprotein M [Channa argus]|uniref:Selenoprotein M n=1 Tax=Channa argus TaxID=215402 RepID=A0A6G1Q055_CHAAH|nr:Selenoprotein M [Channa argus]